MKSGQVCESDSNTLIEASRSLTISFANLTITFKYQLFLRSIWLKVHLLKYKKQPSPEYRLDLLNDQPKTLEKL